MESGILEFDDNPFVEKTGDELLIEVIRGYPVLYNKTLPDHKNQLVVNNAWTEIGIVVGLPVKECQERFRRLKQYYSKERVIREKETRSGAGATTRKTWELFEYMTFLDKHMIRRKAFTSSVASTPGTSHQNTNETEIETLEIENDKPADPKDLNQKKKCFNEPSKKRKADPLEQSFLRMNAGIETIVHNLNNSQESDAEENFGKLIASELKKKSENERASLKRRIMEIIY